MRLEITEPAEKDLIKLDRKNQRRIGAALDAVNLPASRRP